MNRKKLIVFDIHGTLTEDTSVMDEEMSFLLAELLKVNDVALLSGGDYAQCETQILKNLQHHAPLQRLFLFPVYGTNFYRYEGFWKKVYEDSFTAEEKEKIMHAFETAFKNCRYAHPATIYGHVFEDRNVQIAFSALGMKAPRELKNEFDPDKKKRKQLKEELGKLLPECTITIRGATTIDVMKKGVNKEYGIEQIEKYLTIPRIDMLFIGDDFSAEGNDYPVKSMGIEFRSVTSIEDTKKIIRQILAGN